MAKLFQLNEKINDQGVPAFSLPDNNPFSLPSIEVTKLGNFNPPTGFSNIDGIEVENGYRLCIFSGENQRDKTLANICLSSGRHHLYKDINPLWAGNTKSFRLMKDCNNDVNIWDKDCNTLVDTTQVADPCSVPTSRCYKNRIDYCNKEGQNDVRCLPFCIKNNGNCDGFMTRYCEKNKDKKECSCINSPASKYNPLCIDNSCINDGYATVDMIGKKCMDNLDCGLYHKIKDISKESGKKISFLDKEIDKRCSADAFIKGATTTEEIIPSKVDIIVPEPPAAAPQKEMTVLSYIFMILPFIIGIVFIAMRLYRVGILIMLINSVMLLFSYLLKV